MEFSILMPIGEKANVYITTSYELSVTRHGSSQPLMIDFFPFPFSNGSNSDLAGRSKDVLSRSMLLCLDSLQTGILTMVDNPLIIQKVCIYNVRHL